MSDVNIPQLVFLAVVGFLVVRWYLKPGSLADPSSSSSSGSRTASSRTGLRGEVPPQTMVRVERVAQMFPQLERRDILWDLQRHGGDVQGTIERVLSLGRLGTPPQSFQPIFPTPANASPAARPNASQPSKSAHPDLITRYNLSSKLSASSPSSGADSPAIAATSERPLSEIPTSSAAKEGWSSNKVERAQLLQRRREEMILAARRKMEEEGKGA
ncbi:hypothetical protein P152DRAFT_455996 [Eremomyces bilateralis CBS 781.70]|uniref:CUE domain-containing protein n=1 Tax=Eremomyces bilateralis CBS 781.70 TaxID=1392243 RepID=A0A6G1GAL8_9PEZI|nr:uncharacterized protein P152DRAFT_455996 [Eremomyces bilateralis CBS 781.70]KAF1814951.1 hypothetical protein P152DRAFT_455996 [Eremomyces bilateralis CBS 781.70]